MQNHTDVAILGGGLSGVLIGYALHKAHPDLRVLIIESQKKIGGSQIWSFHESDLSAQALKFIEPFIVHRWQGQQVRFPEFKRDLTTPYLSIDSTRLQQVVMAEMRDKIVLGADIVSAHEDSVTLSNDEPIQVKSIIDCRGKKTTEHLTLGFQKFLGQTLKLRKPHGLKTPIIMDASVVQLDGYRFVYVLPYDENTLMVEDTRYADGDKLDVDQLSLDIEDYCTRQAWEIESILTQEDGVLPIALGGDIEAFWGRGEGVNIARAGMAAALFHPLTGYSLPQALHLAIAISNMDDFRPEALYKLTKEYSVDYWRSGAYYRLLCRMLFQAAEPDQRYKVLQRFYKLPQPLIERLYAGTSTRGDKMRILMGKPPVPITKALGCLFDPHRSLRN